MDKLYVFGCFGVFWAFCFANLLELMGMYPGMVTDNMIGMVGVAGLMLSFLSIFGLIDESSYKPRKGVTD